MSFVQLLAMAEKDCLTVTVRVKPLMEGYTVLIQAGSIGGARPMYEKSYGADVPRMVAIDDAACLPLDYFDPKSAAKRRPLNV